MSRWNRLFKRSSETHGAYEQIIAEALARGEDPRYSPAIGELLGLLWEDKAPVPLAVHILTGVRVTNAWSRLIRVSDARLQGFCHDLVTALRDKNLEAPATPEQRYTAVIAALSMLMPIWKAHTQVPRKANEHLRPTVLPPIEETFYNFVVALAIVQQLQAVELHGICCDLLLTVEEALIKERGGQNTSRLSMLQGQLIDTLAALPPEEIPQFWRMLKDPRTSREFWPIVRRMRDRRDVPFLLDALPELALDGQSAVIVALQQIGDARAVPALQALAADKSSLIAPIAEQAVAHILKHSRDDAAQLLRPTDSRHAGNAGETLLRPAASTPDANVRAEELLRPGSAPEE